MESRAFIATLTLGLGACATPQRSTLGQFEAALAAQDSATAALGQWCAAHHIADPSAITARPVKGEALAPPAEVRQQLQVGADEPVGYRHVLLACGSTVLSIAQNWFVPDRLTPDMNHTLDTSDTPFGKVVAPLHFTRERLASQRGRAPGCPAGTVLSHRAVLKLPDGRPISFVVECYTAANLTRTH